MRTEQEVRDEIARMEREAMRYETAGRGADAADARSDAAVLRWVLG